MNDQHGHAVGDEILKACCNRIFGAIRGSDSVGRIGGDEFVVLLDHVGEAEGAMEVAIKILEAIRLPMNTQGMKLALSASIGIAVFPDNALNDESLLRCADLAMYQAKEAGRSSIIFFSEAMAK
jgi:diguanylate cyclase (GGDEF)-like protein